MTAVDVPLYAVVVVVDVAEVDIAQRVVPASVVIVVAVRCCCCCCCCLTVVAKMAYLPPPSLPQGLGGPLVFRGMSPAIGAAPSWICRALIRSSLRLASCSSSSRAWNWGKEVFVD